jgi:putative ubiquitin-RnfH superfamily antitoxin RatB of RatAB toxin-antitoxin module
MKIEVVVSVGPRRVLVTQVECTTALSAVQAKALALQQLGLDASEFATWRSAVWGKSVKPDHGLAAGDRLEVLRPLLVDPKEARRLRFNQQGSRAAGLFAKRRQGAKAGY